MLKFVKFVDLIFERDEKPLFVYWSSGIKKSNLCRRWRRWVDKSNRMVDLVATTIRVKTPNPVK